MLLNKLESGFLLLQTPQGPVAVEPSSFWERVYLLWTFRNFRQLSPLLLNPRQIALINELFFEHAAVVLGEYEPRLEIGVVEDFVPPAIESDPTQAAKIDALPTMNTRLPERAAGQNFTPVIIPISLSPAVKFDGPPARKEEKAKKESTATERAELAPQIVPDRSFRLIVSWLRLASSNLRTYKLVVPRHAMFRFAGAIGALTLCVCFIVAGYRVGAVSGSHAHNSPPQRNWPDSPSAPMPTPVAVNPASAPEGPAEAIADPEAEVKPAPGVPAQAIPNLEVAVKPSPAKIAPTIATTRRMMTPERRSREATSAVARSSGGSDSAVLSRVPTPTSSRRMTLAPGSRGAMERSAQSYFDLAKRQMRMGNYSEATANYQRAWRIEEIIAAAKGRLARARRAMQAKNEIIADRR
jgi:hypothetical protein